jgi:hypothetical protein
MMLPHINRVNSSTVIFPTNYKLLLKHRVHLHVIDYIPGYDAVPAYYCVTSVCYV